MKERTNNSIENNLLILEYSPSQDAFNICTFDEMLHNNQKAFQSGQFTDYIIIYTNTSRDRIDKVYKRACDIIDFRKNMHLELDQKKPANSLRETQTLSLESSYE